MKILARHKIYIMSDKKGEKVGGRSLYTQEKPFHLPRKKIPLAKLVMRAVNDPFCIIFFY